MSDDFDPYYKWLAIPPSEQPPNHYRLLGVPLYTDDPDVIENAADQRMAHLRSFQSGKYSQESQRLLNEVATARVCLLNADKKTEYDETLRRELQPVTPPTTATVLPQPLQPVSMQPMVMAPQPVYLPQPNLQPIPLPPPVPPPVVESTQETSAAPSLQSRPAKRKPAKSPLVEVGKHIAASAMGLLCGYLLVGFFSPAWDHYGLFHRKPVAVNPSPNPNPNPNPNPKPVPPVTIEPVTQPAPPQPARKNDDPPPRQKLPPEPATPVPTAEELARKAAEEKQERLTKLQADRDAAIAAGQVVQALKLTAEFAQLSELDPRAEKARTIDALRKVDHPPAETLVLATAMLEQAQHSLESHQQKLAAEQATAALQLARKTTDQDLVRQATKLILDIQQPE